MTTVTGPTENPLFALSRRVRLAPSLSPSPDDEGLHFFDRTPDTACPDMSVRSYTSGYS